MVDYELMMPAQIGMQSFVQALEKLRNVMARHGHRGFIEMPLAQRTWDTATGQRQNARVAIFRVKATRDAWAEIHKVIFAEFFGKAVYTINGADVPMGTDAAQPELEL